MSAELQKLLQAVDHFEARTRGAELPEGLSEAVEGLKKVAGHPMPDRDTPGAREALKLAQGTTGTGAALKDSAKGPDAPSPGQREAQSVSAEIAKAAESIVANQQQ